MSNIPPNYSDTQTLRPSEGSNPIKFKSKGDQLTYEYLMQKYYGFPSFEKEVPHRSDIYELSEGKDWLGKSVYDQDFYNEQELENLMDVRAENQPTSHAV